VLLLKRVDQSDLSEFHEPFHSTMEEACTYKISKDSPTKISQFETFDAIIVFEPSLMDVDDQATNMILNRTLVSYTKRGGTVIFTDQIASEARAPSRECYFPTYWGLPWKMGDYSRGEFEPNPGANFVRGQKFTKPYEFKATEPRNVDPASAMLRRPLIQYDFLEDEFRPSSTLNKRSTDGAVIWHKYGAGWTGWTGDVNNTEKTHQIVRLMCGI
jgi:hypothetical protein